VEIIKIIAVAVAFAVAVWVLYMLVKMSDKAKEERSNEAPYKIEPPTTEQLALPYEPNKWVFVNTEPESKRRSFVNAPKRKYTKRDKAYWKKIGKTKKSKTQLK
jgi:flagellar basal body-associated protein FliL